MGLLAITALSNIAGAGERPLDVPHGLVIVDGGRLVARSSGGWDPEVKNLDGSTELAITLIKAAATNGCDSKALRQDLIAIGKVVDKKAIVISLGDLDHAERTCLHEALAAKE
jgi:hypothetical protein